LQKLIPTVTKLTDDQKEALGEMTDLKKKHLRKQRKSKMEKTLAAVRGGYCEFYKYQSERSFYGEVHYTYDGLWDIMVFMFLGMAFFKNGVITGQASTKVYWGLFIGGLGIGLILSYFRLQPLIDYAFNRFDYTKNVSFEFYEISRTFRALGIFGLIMLLYKSGWFKWLFALMRPVGQMAFTNYLMQSLLVGLFFYGVGFGMYGKLERHEIYYVVLQHGLLKLYGAISGYAISVSARWSGHGEV
jgi:uncharacterized protein